MEHNSMHPTQSIMACGMQHKEHGILVCFWAYFTKAWL